MKAFFGKTKDGNDVHSYTITNASGAKAVILDYGATVQSLFVPDKNGNLTDVVLGYDTVEGYEKGGCFFGAIIGRNANRIANAKVTLDGVEYQLPVNDNENNLHSNPVGIDNVVWTLTEATDSSITLSVNSPDMSQGFPGNMDITVTYTMLEENALSLKYHAIADKKTIANMTNHSYFNLGGHTSGYIGDHEVKLDADFYTPVLSSHAIPSVPRESVKQTPFDFTRFKSIDHDINLPNIQLEYGNGYDHNFVINGEPGTLRHFATVRCAKTGIQLDLSSDQVGTQLYTGNFIGQQTGKGGAAYDCRHALCLEPQFIPNAMNIFEEGSSDSPVLPAGKAYTSETIYAFSVNQ